MTAHHTVDSINSDALDALYAERDMLGREADRLRKDWVDMRTRAEQAEAAIERVRQLATQWAILRTYGSAAYELRAALDEQPPATEPLHDEDGNPICTCAYGARCPTCQAEQPTT